MNGFIYALSGFVGCMSLIGALIVALRAALHNHDVLPAVCGGLVVVGVYHLIVSVDALKRL